MHTFNRFIQVDNDNGLSPYYCNYMKSPLLQLTEALKPVISNTNRYDSQITAAEILYNCSSTYHLTKSESAAIFLYSNESIEPIFYKELNLALRSKYLRAIEIWFPYLKLLMTALEKLPTIKGKFWRRISSNILTTFRENDEIIWGCVNSCMVLNDLIQNLANSTSVLCSIEVINGKDIHDYTHDKNIHEIVLLPGTCLRVKKIDYDSFHNPKYAHLIEIDKKNDSNALSIYPVISTRSKLLENSSDNEQHGRDIAYAITNFLNGDRFEVIYKKDGNVGYGKYFTVNGDIYDEIHAFTKANGDGFRISSNGDRWEGTFKENKMYGYGTLSCADGYTYLGQWYADKPDGEGISTWPNGSHYQGSHKNGRMHGHGVFYSVTGDKYSGDLIEGKAYGKGIRIWSDGDQYEGEFKSNKKHGYGVYKYSVGGRYAGDWINDKMNGKGVLKWASKTEYDGSFKYGKRHGVGILKFSDGRRQNGTWDNDKYIG